MRFVRLVAFGAIASGAVAAPAAAQQVDTQRCPAGTITLGVPDNNRATQDACQKAIDLFNYLAPQLGTVIAGGNAALGSGGTLGGLGHISFGLRVNAIRGSIPQVGKVTLSVQGAEQTTFETKDQIIPLPVADVAIGLFGGLPLGLTNVGGVDLLVSATYLPEFDGSNVSVKVPGGSVQLGYGARVGILQESLVIPGVSFSYLRRDLPTVDIIAKSAGDSLAVTSTDVKTTAWRITASKSFFMFGLMVGAGKDKYESDADVTAHVAARTAPLTSAVTRTVTPSISQDLTRTTYFADLSFNLPFFRLVGEIGQASGGDVGTYNRFDGKAADASRVYGSVGIRLGW